MAELKQGRTQNQVPPVTNTIDISSWKTYRNEKYGFEVKYPSYYSVCDEYVNSYGNILIGKSMDSSMRYSNVCELAIYFEGISLNISKDNVSDIRKKYQTDYKSSFAESHYVSGTLDWTIFQYELKSGEPLPSGIPESDVLMGKYKMALIQKNTNTFSISIDPNTTLTGNEFNQILSIFKFLK